MNRDGVLLKNISSVQICISFFFNRTSWAPMPPQMIVRDLMKISVELTFYFYQSTRRCIFSIGIVIFTSMNNCRVTNKIFLTFSRLIGIAHFVCAFWAATFVQMLVGKL